MKSIIATVCIDNARLSNNFSHYTERSYILLDSALKFTPFDICLFTDNLDNYKNYFNNKRVILQPIPEDIKIKRRNTFDYTLKRLPIDFCSKLTEYDVVYHNDCDCFYTGWDNKNFEKQFDNKIDAFYLHYHPSKTVGGDFTNKNFVYLRQIISNLGDEILYDKEKLFKGVSIAETRVLYRNGPKLRKLCEFWNKISERINKYIPDTPTNPDYWYFTMSAKHADMEEGAISNKASWASYCKLIHQNRILNYWNCTEILFDSLDEIRNKFDISPFI